MPAHAPYLPLAIPVGTGSAAWNPDCPAARRALPDQRASKAAAVLGQWVPVSVLGSRIAQSLFASRSVSRSGRVGSEYPITDRANQLRYEPLPRCSGASSSAATAAVTRLRRSIFITSVATAFARAHRSSPRCALVIMSAAPSWSVAQRRLGSNRWTKVRPLSARAELGVPESPQFGVFLPQRQAPVSRICAANSPIAFILF